MSGEEKTKPERVPSVRKLGVFSVVGDASVETKLVPCTPPSRSAGRKAKSRDKCFFCPSSFSLFGLTRKSSCLPLLMPPS